jgi:L-ascorbate 6-phosphate lactonase
MGRLAELIQTTIVEPGSLGIFWIGQAGFVYKTPGGSIIYVDPYLTDFVARKYPRVGYGFKRITGCPITPEEVQADLVVSTHAHEDHLDQGAVPAWLRNPRIHFVGAPDCREPYRQLGVPEDRRAILTIGQVMQFRDFRLTGVYADHGEQTPHAIGILLTVGDITVWQVGDTAYRPERWQDVFALGVDVIVPPINGMYGNLNGVEAARLAHDARARVVIPCHFWTFVEHGSNPLEFMQAREQLAPEVKPVLMAHGELFVYRKHTG